MAKLTPKERREQLRRIKLEKQSAKSARLRMAPSEKSGVRVSPRFAPDSSPKNRKNPDTIMEMRPEFRHEKADIDGVWSWGVHRKQLHEDWDDLISPLLAELERLTWAEIMAQTSGGRKKHHGHNADDLCKEAFDRWGEFKHPDTVFRFRLGNLRRLWGYRQVDKFFLVWWDPTHKIYPTEPS